MHNTTCDQPEDKGCAWCNGTDDTASNPLLTLTMEGDEGIEYIHVKFGIVLLTPDDLGYANTDVADKAQPRARQNIVLKMSTLLSSIG